MARRIYVVALATAALALSIAVSRSNADAGPSGLITGRVLDPLGERVPEAAVALLRAGARVSDASSSNTGEFSFDSVEAGRYQIEVRAAGFEPRAMAPFFLTTGAHVTLDVPLSIGLKQDVVVTASATELPASQVAAPVTVLDRQTLDDLAKPSVLEALRLVPGTQIVQTGGRGGIASFFVRGGASNFNKILIDGVTANTVGGAFNFADLSTAGVERIEVLRDANSVLYGSDALAGVVSITTRRGHSRIPELSYSADAGSLGTFHHGLSLAGAARQLDYFGEYSHFVTDNDLLNNDYRNDTFAGHLGYALGGATDVRAVVRHIDSEYGTPNAFDFFGISDDSRQTSKTTYASLVAQSQLTTRWQGSLRLTVSDDRSRYENPSPTGEAFDPFGFGANYLGKTVTIRGANGFTTSGRAILDYGGEYPQVFESQTKRRTLSGQTTYTVSDRLDASAGVRLEHEAGFSGSGPDTSTKRDNAGAFLELRGTLRHAYATAGLGYDHNAVFGSAVTPRLSVAWYLREPSPTSFAGDTKLVANAGTGIKAPGISQENSSLFELLKSAPSPAPAVSPIGPERTRGLDLGIEQGLSQGRVRLRVAFFHREFEDLIEFVSKPVLPQLGVPSDVAAATPFGAYVNSSSYRARGIETAVEAKVGRDLRVTGSYTYLDAVVTKSFTGSALEPSMNPAYPDIQIGAYAPLVGAAPFRRPKHSGNLLLTYARGPAQVSLAGHFVGKAADSTFRSDGFFGSTLLLPNRDLNAGYQKVDLSGSYQVLRNHLRAYASVENVLDKRYTPSFGFPALPRTFRVGLTGTIGGDGAAER